MTKDEALKMAYDWLTCVSTNNEDEVTQACKEALEQPAQEPEYIYVNPVTQEQYAMTKIVNTHPAPSWQGLNDDEIDKIIAYPWGETKDWVRAIEQALKEKNNAM
jgi:hypothetical protein